MRYSPYEFKKEDAYRFARTVGATTRVRDNELNFKVCPFCKGTGRDNEYKFSINLSTGLFNCLRSSCGRTGNMVQLAQEFKDFSLGREIDDYYIPKPERKAFRKPKEPIVSKPKAIEYLGSRGISEETVKRYSITVHKDHDYILMFPFYDDEDNLFYVKYRNMNYKKGDKGNKEWCQKGGTPILFGMKQCNRDNRTLIITEGQIDALSVIESGVENTVSVPMGVNNFTWVPHCWNWINDNFDTIIVFGDNEKGHITLLEDIKKRFKRLTIRCVREEDYKNCKDANAILQKYGKTQIITCVENATIVPVNAVIQLADVEYVNIYKLEKIRSGFQQLDKLLVGGIPFGGIVLISGKSGKGKSTLASQIIMNALRQGYICFAYSGELPNSIFRAWIDYQVAGSRHIIEQEGYFKEKQYVIDKKDRDIMTEWYRDRFYLYDNQDINDELTDLLKIIEKVVMQYGVRVILIDNLMTAMSETDVKGENELDKQKNFVNSLRNMGRSYNILILLVAHKRKNSQGSENGDDISGSANIYNMALMNISYDSDSDIEQDERKIKVTKNRFFGKIDVNGFVVQFEEKSKRIYGIDDDVNYETECFLDKDGFGDINEKTPWE